MEIDAEEAEDLGQAFLRRRDPENPDTSVNELYQYYAVDLNGRESSQEQMQEAFCFVNAEEIFRTAENSTQLFSAEAEVMKKALELLEEKRMNRKDAGIGQIYVDEPIRKV